MLKSFDNLKRKSLFAALIKSLAVGICCALLAVGVQALVIKLAALKIAWYYYLAVGAVFAAVGFCAAFLCVRPTDKRLAKKLDDEYALKEKVQTMVEFYDKEGDLLRLQRDDTDVALKTLHPKKFSFRKIWRYFVLGAVSVAVIVTAIVVPSRYKPPFDDDAYELSSIDEAVLLQLITDVKGFAVSDTVKEEAVAELEALLDEARKADKWSSVRAIAKTAASDIDDAVIAANSYREVALRLNTNKALNDVKLSLLNALAWYKTGNKISAADTVTELTAQSQSKLREELSVFTEEFVNGFETLTSGREIYDKLAEFLEPFNESMAPTGDTDSLQNDTYYLALSDFSTQLGIVYDEYDSRSVDGLREIISSAAEDYVTASVGELYYQVNNRIADEYICNVLSGIFKVGLSPKELTLPGMTDEDASGGDDPEHSGSIGDETSKVGSDDEIFDPEAMLHVKYGTVIDDYYAAIYAMINDENSGLSEEMKNYLIKYFQILYGTNA